MYKTVQDEKFRKASISAAYCASVNQRREERGNIEHVYSRGRTWTLDREKRNASARTSAFSLTDPRGGRSTRASASNRNDAPPVARRNFRLRQLLADNDRSSRARETRWRTIRRSSARFRFGKSRDGR